MKTFALTLKQKSGLLSELQSDTIYGHFCWRLKETLGEQKLKDFINYYRDGKPIFLLSDGLLKVKDEIRFPRPLLFEKSEIKKEKYEKVLSFVNNKLTKERDYLTLAELNDFLQIGKVSFRESELYHSNHSKKKIKKPILEESLRVSVQIDRNTYGSMEGRLFSYKPIYSREDVSYVILIKVLEEDKYSEFNCSEILSIVFSIGFGKKKSSGFGQFEFPSIDEFKDLNEPQDSSCFMVLGNYLPSNNDEVSPIGYDVNTKYGKFGEELSLSENPFKNPIAFLTAGSCFKTNVNKNFYGRITEESEISKANNFAVQFGMPFILKINLL